jgi:hypothetical protein
MATWTPPNRNSASWSNTNRNTAVFAGLSKSGAGMTFGDLNNDQIGTMTNDDIFQGRPIGDWSNSDPISGTIWTNTTRN